MSNVQRHDILALCPVGDENYTVKVGALIKLQRKGCYKIFLDLDPVSPDLPLLIMLRDPDAEHIAELGIFHSTGQLTHRIYAYIPFVGEDGSEHSSRRRIGSIFSTRNDFVMSLKLNFVPRHPDASIMAFDYTLEAREDSADKTAQGS